MPDTTTPQSYLKEAPVRKIRRYGWRPDLPDPRDRLYAAPRPVLLHLPKQADLRGEFMPVVYDQGQLGSCTGNAIAALCEYMLRKDPGSVPDVFTPSRLFIYYNERSMEGTIDVDAGAMIRDGIRSLMVYGFCNEQEWTYDDGPDKFRQRPSQECYQHALKELVVHPIRVPQHLNYLKASIVEGRPVVFGFSVFESFESDEVAKTGVMPIPLPSERCVGGHAVMMVGYNDEQQRFIVRNSWGTSWGDKGYFTMPYSIAVSPDMSSDYWTVTDVP